MTPAVLSRHLIRANQFSVLTLSQSITRYLSIHSSSEVALKPEVVTFRSRFCFLQRDFLQ